MPSQVTILGLAGSLRKGSFNRAALRAAMELVPEDVTIEPFDLAPIPLYDDDVQQAGTPEIVQAFKARIAAADGLLIVTPEYNYSIPGVLKNAIDWASRPANASPLVRKPVAIMGASTGLYGTVRAQLQLRTVLAALNMPALNKPEVLIARAGEKFDAEGHLVDETTRGFVRQLLVAYAEWVRRLRGY
ncbi:MAG: NADPH-dependent FMN reductase [Chloroflexota bacterium]